jgi:hypothetical protein
VSLFRRRPKPVGPTETNVTPDAVANHSTGLVELRIADGIMLASPPANALNFARQVERAALSLMQDDSVDLTAEVEEDAKRG